MIKSILAPDAQLRVTQVSDLGASTAVGLMAETFSGASLGPAMLVRHRRADVDDAERIEA